MVGHEGAVNTVAVDANGRFAVTGGKDGTGRIWDLRTGNCLQLLLGHTSLGKPFHREGTPGLVGSKSLIELDKATVVSLTSLLRARGPLWSVISGPCI